jgi:hypothetical protein
MLYLIFLNIPDTGITVTQTWTYAQGFTMVC